MLRGSGCYDLCALPDDPPECGGEHAVDFLWGKLEGETGNKLFVFADKKTKRVLDATRPKFGPIISMLETAGSNHCSSTQQFIGLRLTTFP